MLEALASGTGVVLLLAGCALATVGLIGMILKPDLFEQLHVAGLVTGPGVILVLLASIGTRNADIITSAILVMVFVLVTSSVSTHVIARAGIRRYAPTQEAATTGLGMDVVAPVPTSEPATAPLDVTGGDDTQRPRPLASGMRVVVAHDGSPAAHVAADLVAAIDWPAGTVIRLVEAAPGEIRPLDPSSSGGSGTGEPGAATRGSAKLESVAQRIGRPTIHVEPVVLHGDAADVIIDETASFAADLLVTGSRRRGLVPSLLGLSAAGEIVDRAPCPVLVARSTSLRSVMLTTDGSDQSAAAIELVARWPIFDLARIHVVAVSADAPQTGRRRLATASITGEHQRNVDAAAAPLMDAGRDVVTEVLHGRPGTEIVEAAKRRSVDVIVIGSRGRTGLGRTLLGSVAGEVLASAGCSVLIVAPPARRPIRGT